MSTLALKHKRLKDLAACVSTKKHEASGLKAFTSGFYKDAPPADVGALSPANLAEVAEAAFAASAKRRKGTPTIQISNPPVDGFGGDATRIIIVNDNMPFLVDTVTGALTALGVDIDMIFHPIVNVKRDKNGARCQGKGTESQESIIVLHVDRRGERTQAKMRAELKTVLADNKVAVRDWREMLKRLSACSTDLKFGQLPVAQDVANETAAFLDWLAEDNFTLLGHRYLSFDGDLTSPDVKIKSSDGLGILRKGEVKVWRGPDGMSDTSPELLDFLAQDDPILITKANARATVHRRVHMDYVGVKAFDEAGNTIGEHRFVGLFTSAAYARPARTVPIMREKIASVSELAGYDPRSHAGKALAHVLDTFPRDELIQIDPELLLDISLGVLSLSERPRARAFVRPDRFERFVSVLTYIPREVFDGKLRERIGALLSARFDGYVSVYYVQLNDNVLTRVHYIIRTEAGQVPSYDVEELNDAIADLIKGWSARFLEALIAAQGEEDGRRLFYSVRDAFSAAYRDHFAPDQAVLDLAQLAALEADNSRDKGFRFYRTPKEAAHQLRLKIYCQSHILALSDCLPMLENLGLRVIDEWAYGIETSAEHPSGWVHDFLVEEASGRALDLGQIDASATDTLTHVAAGRLDNDNYNMLVIAAGIDGQQANMLRAYGRYAQQLDLPFTRSYVENCLVAHPKIVRQLVDLFAARFDPKLPEKTRRARCVSLARGVEAALEDVKSLDDDRILRLFLSAINATLRTNYYQADADGHQPPQTLAFKMRSANVLEMPAPAPHAEMYVFGPRVEGVHLRGGPVARGGLRWTDRPEDYRTEVLGLVKAQIVKNSVIVPVGAKGGFLPRQLPQGGSRDAIFEEGREAYKVFISNLIGLTDNIVSGKIKPPRNVVRHDGDDPYLVVAADKGTATFSDTANAIALEKGFWLGDAFASGGSNGYDHKKMGITAKGAWVSVQRHFREIGVNTQKDAFKVVGVGDMSGDVFGNGMLLSKTIKLIGAFDHRNIFVDPDPDTAASYKERKRIFGLQRSSWLDYNPKLLSKGGAIFDRNAKKLNLSPQIKSVLDIEKDSVTPQELMRAILLAQVDLLWFGGIGTYVKGRSERNADVGDRANDAIRVNGEDLRVKVIGEGANLGITQGGRLDFASVGGRLNADFIDNSAGVDCSDNEVNLKIALDDAVTSGKLKATARDALLQDMTEDVSALVLRDNYLQSQAISMAEAQAGKNLDRQTQLIRRLEREGRVSRALDGLPSDEQIVDMAERDAGLSRPEIASLMCHAKIAIFDALVASDVVDDPALENELMAAFPAKVQKSYPQAIQRHRLRREIIATKLANAVINRGGLTLVFDLDDSLGCGLVQAVAAFVVVREIFALRTLWQGIDALDYKVPANIQTLMHAETAFALRRQMTQLLQSGGTHAQLTISAMTDRYGPSVAKLLSGPSKLLCGLAAQSYAEKQAMYIEQGAGKNVADTLAGLEALGPALIITDAALNAKAPVDKTAMVYFELNGRTGADWIRQTLIETAPADQWERRALGEIEIDLAQQQTQLVGAVMGGNGKATPAKKLETWLKANAEIVSDMGALVRELDESGPATVAKLGYAVRHMRSALSSILNG